MVDMTELGVPKAHLARTADHDAKIGSTANPRLAANPGKTLAEIMNEEDLRNFIFHEVYEVSIVHREAVAGDKRMIKALPIVRDNYLTPNLLYLREIGRLPTELEDVDPATDFAL